MKKILVTGGTTFVSKYVATYFKEQGYDVYVLNRNTKPQVEGVTLIEADRHALKDELKPIYFDVVADITAYNEKDVTALLKGLGSYGQYLLVSSSAVYKETGQQPFKESEKLGQNKFWGQYGIDKIAAEKKLLLADKNAYIVRPPYLYGAMNNVYREAFVFECALKNRAFYLPKDGSMQLQFFHVRDLCRFFSILIEQKPDCPIFNVGNKKTVSIKDWVTMCYACAGKKPDFVEVHDKMEQRSYFSFYDYEYTLDVTKQEELMPETMSLQEGLKEAFEWYVEHEKEVNRKPYFEYIREHLE